MVKLTPCWAPNVTGEKMLVSFVPAGDQQTRPLGSKSNTLPQLGLPYLRNLVNNYTSSSNRKDSVYTEIQDLIFFIMQIGKIADIFHKKLLKNVPCANI